MKRSSFYGIESQRRDEHNDSTASLKVGDITESDFSIFQYVTVWQATCRTDSGRRVGRADA